MLLSLFTALGLSTFTPAAPAPLAPATAAVIQEDLDELEELLEAERAEADRLRRRGSWSTARRILSQHLEDEPSDAASRVIRAQLALDESDYELARSDAERALADARKTQADPAIRARCARVLAELELELGRALDALRVLDENGDVLSVGTDARDAWLRYRVLRELGLRDAAAEALARGQRTSKDQAWDGLLARAMCERTAGQLERSFETIDLASTVAKKGDGPEPALFTAVGDLYFEAHREVEEAQGYSASQQYKRALSINERFEPALLGLFELHRTNWRRSSRSPGEILNEALSFRPRSIAAHLAGTTTDLEDGSLRATRSGIERLEQLAPGRRDVRTLRASLAAVERDAETAQRILDELAEVDPADSRPEREVGRHLVELYRFAEGLPYLRSAVERDPDDYLAWTQLARALANTGDEKAALKAFDEAKRAGGLRRDAWRENTQLALEIIDKELEVADHGNLSFAWRPDAAEVLQTYLLPFYKDAREELAARYGFTPGAVRIEVFREHSNFSARSTGFEGFPALGVCFGPVVTALSPLSEMRGQFSWARTGYHEFTHVIHLGLSHNRCPRWITEGLATWEEARKNPAWQRNMRRELVDSHANGMIIPVRDLNRAFRGPRILFGYYQGGIVCEVLIREHGFEPMIRLLEAFDRGDDLDVALDSVYSVTPEELDVRVNLEVERMVAELQIEPRWHPHSLSAKRLSLPRALPDDEAGQTAWRELWTDLAWGAWQSGRRADAEEALRRSREGGVRPARGLFLEAELAISDRNELRAAELYDEAFEAGGEDFLARIARGGLREAAGDLEGAELEYRAAEADFPGFADKNFAAELRLASLYVRQDRSDEAMQATARYLAFDPSAFAERLRVAEWHMAAGRAVEAERLYHEANEVDPFSRRLHKLWAEALVACGRLEEALREYGVALIVPPNLDRDQLPPLAGTERAELLAGSAAVLLELERFDEARSTAETALAADADCAEAQAVLDRLGP
jgi:predicted Zn-dependent protease